MMAPLRYEIAATLPLSCARFCLNDWGFAVEIASHHLILYSVGAAPPPHPSMQLLGGFNCRVSIYFLNRPKVHTSDHSGPASFGLF